MKTLALTIAFSIISLLGIAQEKNEGQNITITIDNVKNEKGKVVLGLHDKSTFMKTSGLENAKVSIEDGKISYTFENVKPGEYAILALHDENENNRMDFDNGMPQEDYGTSNNPLNYGPPTYSEAKFKVEKENISLNIRF